ncbi:radical SAM protein [Polyangium sp. y55x31]|uniref:radical SAM/SPASM domain-containing protein n=1 Tax=Polyangium sp. y55x31 TaxID=3042688 RepID=UPI0024826D4D|nr:radical SAM protein [Polyangium sp. y55x31]MDI1483412.1 radical SAM protein [Polyangium sp. y55x31]
MNATRVVRLNVLQQSPHDLAEAEPEEMSNASRSESWVPSRFNVHATTEDGRLILWNTLSTAISVFKPEQVPHVLTLLKAPGFESRREGLAGYLVERGFLVRKGMDEYRKFLLAFGQQHYRTDRLELFVLSSEDCNFRCTYCYEDFARGTMRPGVRNGIKRLVEKRIEELLTLDIRWFGGEPLYGWEAVEDLGPFLSDIAEKHGVAYRSHMTTNAYLLTPEVAEKLLAWRVNAFQITLDGVAATHDCSRPTRDGQGSFATIFQNLEALSQRRDEFSVTLRVNFDKNNHPHLEELFELVEKTFHGDPRFTLDFHAVGRWGGPNDPELEVCGDDERDTVQRALKAMAHRHGLKFSTLKDVNFLGGQVCYAARPFNLIIGASGKVMKCTVVLDKDENNVVGRLHEDGRLELDDDRMALWTEPAFQRDSQCQKCAVLPSCQGISCPLPRITDDARPCVPTRTHSKSELFELLEYPTRKARVRGVAETTGTPARDKEQIEPTGDGRPGTR